MLESVVLVPTDSLDVIPGIGLVAQETLCDIRMRDAGHTHRNHPEMHHIVAGRRLMASGTISRKRRRMPEFRNVPYVG